MFIFADMTTYTWHSKAAVLGWQDMNQLNVIPTSSGDPKMSICRLGRPPPVEFYRICSQTVQQKTV